LFLFLCLTLAATRERVLGQATGDFNGDGLVTASDVAALEACFQGPTVPQPAPDPCSPKDLDGDGDVDAGDAALVMNSFSGPGACNLKYYYAGAITFGPGEDTVQGVFAEIETVQTALCNEGTGTQPAVSLSWVGFDEVCFECDPNGRDLVERLAQVGYGRFRAVPPDFPSSTQVFTRVYTEFWSDLSQPHAAPWYDRRYFAPVPTGSAVYEARKTNHNTGAITYYIDGGSFWSYAHIGWAFQSGDRVTFTGETFNHGDQMPGIQGQPCDFDLCGWWLGAGPPGTPQSVVLFPGDEFEPDKPDRRSLIVSDDHIWVWDARVP